MWRLLLSVIIGEDPFGISDLATSVPAQFSFTIPVQIDCGDYAFSADGTTASANLVDSRTNSAADVEPSDFPKSSAANLSTLTLGNCR